MWTPEITSAARLTHSLDGLFDPLQILAVTASRIRGVDLGTSVTESLRHHPMSLARSLATLDRISKGHAILGIGNGIRENTEPYGVPFRQQIARLEEALLRGPGAVPPAPTWKAHRKAHPLGERHRGFLDLVPPRITAADIDAAAAAMTPELLLTIFHAGSLKQIVEQVAPLAEAGCRHFIIIANIGGAFTDEGMRDLPRMRTLMRALRRL